MKKTIFSRQSSHIPSKGRTTEYRFLFSIVDSSLIGTPEERSKTSDYFIRVGVTKSLECSWDLTEPELIKVLFEYGKRHFIEKLKDGTLSESEELLLDTHSVEIPCPFDPNCISDPESSKIEVELVGPEIMQDPTFLQLAASIIDCRDNINAIFYSKHRQKLILVHEERDLLQFFRDATSQEEFFFRLCALKNAATGFNTAILRDITGNSDSQVKSIDLLDIYLNRIGAPNTEIIKALKEINRMRQGYPVHGDRINGVLKAHEYFNLEYPVVDFSKAWRTLLVKYLNVMQTLLETLKEKS